jgi:hypothetical protein
MSSTHSLFQTPLRRLIEDALDETPHGLSLAELADRVVVDTGPEDPSGVGRRQLLRQLGLLLIEGRVDECGGLWTARATFPLGMSRRTGDRAA